MSVYHKAEDEKSTHSVKQSSIRFASSMKPSIARGRVPWLSDPFLVGGLESKAGDMESDASVLPEGSEYVPEA